MSAGADQQGRRQEVLARQGRQQQASSRTDQRAGGCSLRHDNQRGAASQGRAASRPGARQGGAARRFLFLGNTNLKLLEMEFILPPYTYLGSWQTTRFGENILGTIGDALREENKDDLWRLMNSVSRNQYY